MSEGEPKDLKKAPRKLPELRVSALFLGVPLVLILFVPWDTSDPYTLPPPIAAPLLAMGGLGALLLILAFAKERARLRDIPIAGLLLFGCGVWLFEALVATGSVHPELEHWTRLAFYLWVTVPTVAMGAEMAMHRHPRSRRITLTALIAWLALVLLPLLPLSGTVAWRHTPVANVLRRLELDQLRLGLEDLFPFIPAFIGVLGVLQCLRRLGKDRDRAAARRFRSSWLAWVVFPLPVLGLTLTMIVVALLHDNHWATKHFTIGVAVLAPILGGALAVRGVLGSAWVREARRHRLLAPVLAVFAALVAGAVVLIAGPRWRGDDALVAELANGVGEAVAAGLRGEPVQRRFLGNYSSLDLRGAEGAVELPADARITLVGLRVDTEGDDDRHYGYALVEPDGAVGWVALDDHTVSASAGDPDALPDWLEADGALPDEPSAWVRVAERFAVPGCLPTLDLPAAPGLERHLEFARPACNPVQLRELGGPRYVDGNVIGYLVVFANDGGESVAVGGSLRARTSGAFIGVPRPLEDYPRPRMWAKRVRDIR